MATAPTQTKLKNFIDGETVDPADGATEAVCNPATGEVIAEAPVSSAEDVDRAVAAARRAFESWSRTTPRERSERLLRLADVIEEHADELSALESADGGYKETGYGRDLSMYALEDYTEIKHVMVSLD